MLVTDVSIMFMLSLFSRVRLLPTLWTVVRQAPLSMEFSRQEHYSGLPFPSPGDLPKPGIKLVSLASPALAGEFFTTCATWEASIIVPYNLALESLTVLFYLCH